MADQEGVFGLISEQQFGKLTMTSYTDGSFDRGLHPGLGRAAWSVVQVDDMGTPTKIIRGPVPSDLAQNAVTAHWMAAAVASQYFQEGELHIDCSAVVQGLQCLVEAAFWLLPVY